MLYMLYAKRGGVRVLDYHVFRSLAKARAEARRRDREFAAMGNPSRVRIATLDVEWDLRDERSCASCRHVRDVGTWRTCCSKFNRMFEGLKRHCKGYEERT